MADAWEYDSSSPGGAGDGNVSSPLPAFARDPLGVLRRRWLWMLLCLMVCLGVLAAFVSSRQPTYMAETTILVSSQAIPEEFVRTTVVEDTLAHINAVVGQVLSRQNLAGLVEKYGLFADLRDKLPLSQLIDRMRRDIEIYPQKSMNQNRPGSTSQVFVITYSNTDAEVAADVANELAGFFTAANIAMRNRQAQLTTDFVRRELERAEQELRDHERKITQFMREHRGGLPGELDANLAKLERLQSQRQSLASQIDAAESRLMLLNAQLDSGSGSPTPRSLLAELRSRLEEQLVILTEEHPNVIALRRRIERLESDLAAERSGVGTSDGALRVAAEKRQLQHLRAQAVEIETAIAELDDQVAATPVRQEEFAALEQRATVLRENYLQFLRKVQEAELAQSLESAQQGARISILDSASPPTEQLRARWKILALGMVASLALTLGLAVLLELLDAVVVSALQLEALTDKPVLGSIPRIA